MLSLLTMGATAQQETSQQGGTMHSRASQSKTRSSARIPAGTTMTVRVNESLESGKTTVGQRWTGTLAQDAIASNGRVVARSGAPVRGTVVESKDSGRLKAPGILGLRVTSVNGTPVTTDIMERDGEGHTKSNLVKVGGGTAAGAAVGGLAGGGKGAGIGALIGAGAGTAGALFTGKKQAKVTPETALTFTTR